MFGQDKPDVYGTVNIGSETYQTPVKKNSVEATWDGWAEWLVEHVDGHVVEVNVYDMDTTSSDEFLGYAAIDVSSMTQVSHQYNNQSNSRRTKDSFPSRTIKYIFYLN